MTKVNRYVLDNGLVVLAFNMPEKRKASLGLGIGVGSIHEDEILNGASHFNEHMYFKSNKYRSAKQIALDIECFGGDFNALTSYDKTYYHVDIIQEGIDTVIEIMSQAIANMDYLEEEFELEKRVVIDELGNKVNNLVRHILNNVFIPRLYQDTVFERTVLGTHNSLSNMSKEQLEQFKEKYHHPNNLIFVICGNFNEKAVLAKVNENFGFLEPGNQIPDYEIDLSAQNQVYFEERENLDQVFLAIGYRFCGETNEDLFNLLMLEAILGEGFSSRLFTQLRGEKGIGYSVGSFISPFKKTSCFATCILGFDPTKFNEAKGIILDIFNDLKTNLVSDEELEKTKNMVLSDYYDDLEASSTLAQRFFENELYGLPLTHIFEFESKIKTATKEDILEVANKYLIENYVLTALVPEGFKPE